MRKSVLAASVAVSCMMLVASSAYARGSDDGSSASSTAEAQDRQEIQELEQRVEGLEAEVQSSEQRQAASQPDTSGLESKLTGWWDNTTLSGRMYFDTSWVDQTTNGTRTGTSNGTSFDIKRFYVGIDHTFDDVFAADVTTDFTYDSNLGVSQVYIKKAYLQAKLDDGFIIRLGSADMPWIPFMEDVYGYRYVENTLIDRTKYGNSADWGVHVLGKFYGGLLNYQFSVVNGAGYKKANLFRTNGPDAEGRVNLNLDHFIIGVGGYMGKLGQQFGTPLHHEATRFDAVAAYVTDGARLGVEYVVQSNFSSVTSAVSRDHATGVSGFGSYTFVPEWSVFGRYDYLNKNVLGAVGVPDNYYNVGIEYNPIKIVDLSLVYKHENVQNGTLSTSNGTIGGSKHGDYDEVGLFGQLRW